MNNVGNNGEQQRKLIRHAFQELQSFHSSSQCNNTALLYYIVLNISTSVLFINVILRNICLSS